MEQVYTYDGNRNLLSIIGTNTPWYNQDFNYDALNRLLNADGIFGTIDFTCDNVGNRLTRTVAGQVDSYTYQPGTSRLAQVTGPNPVAFSYDANGNITDIDSRTFVYSQNNRLVRVEEGLDILGEYTYNGLGQRQMKEVAGVTTVFHYDFDGNIIAESQADGTMTAEYLYVDQSRMAMVSVGTGALYFFHNNYLGTPVLMTDNTGTVVWEAEYKPFGEANVNPNSGVVNNFRFPGQYYDHESGLHYNYFRFYDSKTGRYLTPDPIGLAGGINLYSYVSNNPINSIDPLGLYESQWYLQWVPGQHMWDRSVTAFEKGQYGWGAAYLAGMVGEQVLFALTLGEGRIAQEATQCSIETTSSLPPLRLHYENAVRALANKVDGMRRTGMTSEQIARALHAERRALGVQFKNLTDPAKLEQIYARNVEKYGDKLGPSIDYLRNVSKKTWDQIIESASRPGGKDLRF